jgi:hypothetical protein
MVSAVPLDNLVHTSRRIMVIDEDQGVNVTYSEFAEGNWGAKGDVVRTNIQLNTKRLERIGSGISSSAKHSHPLTSMAQIISP